MVGERRSLMGGFFQVGEIITFLAGGRTHPIPPLSLYIYISFVYIICIMCPSDHLTSARFVHFVCHRYIWYIFSLVCSVSIIQQIYHIICLIRPNDGRSISVSFEAISLNILVHDAISNIK